MNLNKTIETKDGTFYLRPYKDEDEEKVIDLWEIAFKTKMDISIWRWKFSNNPFGRQIMLCFNDNDLPIAMYSGIPFPANFNGINIKMTQLIDNLSHPDYRNITSGRKGLFIQNGEYFTTIYAGIHSSIFLYGFPGHRAFRLGKIFLKYTKLAEGGAYLYSDIKNLQNSFSVLGSINTLSFATEDFDILWHTAKSFYPFLIKRNSKFIQWRFFDHPVYDYTVYTYKNIFNEIQGYAVIHIDGVNATIVDIFGLPRRSSIKTLIQYIKNKLTSLGVLSIQTWLPRTHFITDYLIQTGFEIKNEPLGITPTGRSFDHLLDIDFAVNNIYYTMGDGDLF